MQSFTLSRPSSFSVSPHLSPPFPEQLLTLGLRHSADGLMQSFGNLGPGDCLGLYVRTCSDPGSCADLRSISRVSAESYASPVRGTLYGFSAAIGTFTNVSGACRSARQVGWTRR